MIDENEDRADRFASGTGSTDAEPTGDEIMPGVKGGNKTYLPRSGRSDVEESRASSAEGTIGAVGEMDLTGAPSGSSGGQEGTGGASSNAGQPQGGGPGGGAG
jgi:hypothetical protein